MQAFRNALVLSTAVQFLGACVNPATYRHDLAQGRAELAEERQARKAADSLQSIDIATASWDIDAARTEAQVLRTELGGTIVVLSVALQFDLPVNFDFNDATMRDADRAVLDRFAIVVESCYPGAKLTVEGFADAAGSDAYNRVLSQRRADAVRTYLVARGLPASDVRAVGYGKTRPVVPNAQKDAPGAEENRRVTIVIETQSGPMAPPTAAPAAPPTAPPIASAEP